MARAERRPVVCRPRHVVEVDEVSGRSKIGKRRRILYYPRLAQR